MSVRFTQSNWDKFFSSDKKTTIRLHALKPGLHAVLGGSRFKPVTRGALFVYTFKETKKIRDLTLADARNDGFDMLADLLLELGRLNKECTSDSWVFIHPVEVRGGKGGLSV